MTCEMGLRRWQKQFHLPLCDVFCAPITCRWTLNLKIITSVGSLYLFLFADQILSQASTFNRTFKISLIVLSGRQNEQLPYPLSFFSSLSPIFRVFAWPIFQGQYSLSVVVDSNPCAFASNSIATSEGISISPACDTDEWLLLHSSAEAVLCRTRSFASLLFTLLFYRPVNIGKLILFH